MKEWTKQELLNNSYEIESGYIKSVDLSMGDYSYLVLMINIENHHEKR